MFHEKKRGGVESPQDSAVRSILLLCARLEVHYYESSLIRLTKVHATQTRILTGEKLLDFKQTRFAYSSIYFIYNNIYYIHRSYVFNRVIERDGRQQELTANPVLLLGEKNLLLLQ